MKSRLLFLMVLLSVGLGCKKDKTPGYDFGKNRFTTQVDGDTREYYVHVPESYDSKVRIPVVFMLHGTSGDGLKFYNISGWKEVGDAQNVLTVYPSSWTYCINEDGQSMTTTKWNSFPGSFTFCAGESPRDDIKFLRQIVDELKDKFAIDESRIYMAGFSNGGNMTARCSVEMSDILVAVAESAGSFGNDTTCIPMNQIPAWFQVGSLDDRFLADTITSIPMSAFEWIINTSAAGTKYVGTHQRTFGFATTYSIVGDSNDALTAIYPGLTATPPREFRFMLIKGLAHEYPNGINHPVKSAEVQWNWFKQYSR